MPVWDDGRLDTLIVRRVSRAKFLRLAPAYARGEAWRFPDAVRRVQTNSVRYPEQGAVGAEPGRGRFSIRQTCR